MKINVNVEIVNVQKDVNMKTVQEDVKSIANIKQVIKKKSIYVIQNIIAKKSVGLKIALKIVEIFAHMKLLIQ